MSVELKVFGGAYFPKDKALKKWAEFLLDKNNNFK